MGDIVLIDAVKLKQYRAARSLWNVYLSARLKAEGSQDIQDGIAAGKAWAAWLSVFASEYN